MTKKLIAVLFSTSLFLLSCSKTGFVQQCSYSQYDSLKDYLRARQNVQLDTSIKKIFVLTEHGCLPCKKKFTAIIDKNKFNAKAIIIIGISAKDLNLLNIELKKNSFVDTTLVESDCKMLQESKVIYLKNGAIDTVVTIGAKKIKEQFDYIQRR